MMGLQDTPEKGRLATVPEGGRALSAVLLDGRILRSCQAKGSR